MSKKYHIGEFLEAVCGMLSDVSGNVFPGHRPEAKGKQMADLVVVSLPVSLIDLNVQQRTTVRFELMARNKATGVADVPKLQGMLDAISAKFPMVFGRFTVTSPSLVVKGTDGLGFTVWNVQATLKINMTDEGRNDPFVPHVL